MRLLPRTAFRFALAVALAGLAACTSDSPSEPDSGPVGPVTPPQVVQWSISVTADPAELEAGTAQSSNVTIQVRRADTGAPPPNLATVTVTTSLGAFGSAGGPQTVTLQLTNGQAQTVLFPGGAEGTATVRAQFDTSAGFTNVRIGARATFFIESIQPSVGNTQGGETVTITGGGFEEPVRVTFGSATAVVLDVRGNRIRVRTPTATAAGADVGVGETEQVNVGVTINVNEADQATDSIPGGFTYAAGGGNPQQPVVFGLDPTSGSNEGGNSVVIRGQGFDQAVQVLFGRGLSPTNLNGVEAVIQSVSPTQIVVTAPPAQGFGQDNRNQLVDVLVRNINTGFSTVVASQYRYGVNLVIASISPDIGPATGGTDVTIFGQGFDEPVNVRLDGILQNVRSVSGTEIIFRTAGVTVTSCPATGAINANGIEVINLDTGDRVVNGNVTFRYTVPRPQIFGVNPPGPGNVGSTTTVTGQGFASNVRVLFGGTNGSAAQITASSPTSITVRVPTPPPGFTFRTEPCDANGDTVPNGTRPAPTPISVTVENLDSAGCVVTLPNAFTLNPTSTTCTGEDPVPPPPTQCTDGFDNDADGAIDAADPQCTGPTDNSESS